MSDAKTLGHELAGSTSPYPLLTPPEVAAAEPLGRVGTASSRQVRDAYEGKTPSSSNEHLLCSHTRFQSHHGPVCIPGSGFTPSHLMNNGTVPQGQVKQFYLREPCF